MTSQHKNPMAPSEGAQTLATAASHLTVQVHAPQPNVVVTAGDVLTVSGVAVGIGGAEPVAIDKVTVALADPPIEAALTFVAHQSAPTVGFEATVTVPAVTGDQQVGVVAFADDGRHVEEDVPVVVQPSVPPPPPPPPPLWATSPLTPTAALPGAARLTGHRQARG